MFNFRRVIIYVLVLALILGLMVGNVLAEKETINVANMAGWKITEPLWDLAKEGLPDIDIIRIEAPFTELLKKQILESRLHTGAYDVMQGTESWVRIFKPFIVPVQDFMQADSEMDFDQYMDLLFPVAKAQHVFADGKLWTIPLHGGVQFGYYRKDLFTDPKERKAFKEQYGQELPQPDELGMIKFENIDHFVNVAKFFTRDTDNDGEIDLWGLVQPGKWDHGACRFEDELMRAGLLYFDEFGHSLWGPAHPENKEILKAIAAFDQDLVFKYKVSPSYIVSGEMSEIMQTYLSGETVMAISWLGDYWGDVNRPEIISKIGKAGTFSLDFLDYAFNKKTHEAGSFGGFWGWGISVDSNKKDAAYEFIKWTMDENTWKKKLEYSFKIYEGASMPERKDIAEWAAKKGYLPPAMYEAMKTTRTMQVELPELEDARNIVREYHERLLIGEITPGEFVEITGNEIEKMMSEAGYF